MWLCPSRSRAGTAKGQLSELPINLCGQTHWPLVGLAGALDPDWDEGDLSSFHADAWPEFAVWARAKPAVRTGEWHTAHEIIETGLAKLELGRKTSCGLVEMEWDYVAEACRKRQVPLVGLRAVSDHADKLLPADLFLLGCDAVTGKSTPVKIALHLAVLS